MSLSNISILDTSSKAWYWVRCFIWVSFDNLILFVSSRYCASSQAQAIRDWVSPSNLLGYSLWAVVKEFKRLKKKKWKNICVCLCINYHQLPSPLSLCFLKGKHPTTFVSLKLSWYFQLWHLWTKCLLRFGINWALSETVGVWFKWVASLCQEVYLGWKYLFICLFV